MKIELNKILFFDIETAPLPDFDMEHPCFDTWEHKFRNENLTTEELIEKFNKEAGLHSVYSRIVCISTGFFYNGKVVLKSFTGTEEEILNSFLDAANKFVISRKGIISCGHNLIDYDLPYIRQSFSRYHPMFEFPEYFSDMNQKPWDMASKIIDTMKLFKGTAFRFTSLAELALILNLPSPKADADGSMVAELFRKGEIDRIVKYCEGDVFTTICILMKWLGEPLPEKMEITKTEDPLDAAKKIPVISKILSGAKLTKTDKDKLTKALAKYEGTPELEPLLKAIEFVNKDFKFTALKEIAL